MADNLVCHVSLSCTTAPTAPTNPPLDIVYRRQWKRCRSIRKQGETRSFTYVARFTGAGQRVVGEICSVGGIGASMSVSSRNYPRSTSFFSYCILQLAPCLFARKVSTQSGERGLVIKILNVVMWRSTCLAIQVDEHMDRASG